MRNFRIFVSYCFRKDEKSAKTSTPQTPFKKILPQLLAVGAKNLLLLGYGMTLGFPTIAIPSLKGDPSRPGLEGELVLTKEEISWIGKSKSPQ